MNNNMNNNNNNDNNTWISSLARSLPRTHTLFLAFSLFLSRSLSFPSFRSRLDTMSAFSCVSQTFIRQLTHSLFRFRARADTHTNTHKHTHKHTCTNSPRQVRAHALPGALHEPKKKKDAQINCGKIFFRSVAFCGMGWWHLDSLNEQVH